MNIRMKHTIALVAALALVPSVFAGEALQLSKEQLIAHIDARIKILQEARACVGKAVGTAGIAACYERERKQTKALREQSRKELQDRKEAQR